MKADRGVATRFHFSMRSIIPDYSIGMIFFLDQFQKGFWTRFGFRIIWSTGSGSM